MNRQQGFSLLECMLSLTLGLLLCSLLYHVFVSLKQQGDFLGAISEVEATGQATQAILTRELKQAGYAGCQAWHMRAQNTVPARQIATSLLKAKKGQVADSDILALRYWADLPDTKILNIAPNFIEIKTAEKLKPGQALILHDCISATTIKIKKIRRYRGITRLVLTDDIPLDWQQAQLSERIVAQWAVFKHQNTRSLYRYTEKTGWQAIMPDVYQLVLQQTPNHFDISFVVGSMEAVKFKRKTYQVGRREFMPTDYKHYKVFPCRIAV